MFPTANPIKGKFYQLPANTQTIPPVYYSKSDVRRGRDHRDPEDLGRPAQLTAPS